MLAWGARPPTPDGGSAPAFGPPGNIFEAEKQERP